MMLYASICFCSALVYGIWYCLYSALACGRRARASAARWQLPAQRFFKPVEPRRSSARGQYGQRGVQAVRGAPLSSSSL